MNVIPTISFFLFELLFRRYKANDLGVPSLAALSSNSFSKEKVALGKRRHNFFWSCIFKESFPMNIFKPFRLDKDFGNFMLLLAHTEIPPSFLKLQTKGG